MYGLVAGGVLLVDLLLMALPVSYLGMGMHPNAIGLSFTLFGVAAVTFQVCSGWNVCSVCALYASGALTLITITTTTTTTRRCV